VNLCQEQKDKPGEQSVKHDVLLVALRASRAAQDEELRARNAAPDGKPRGRSAARHAKPPEVLGERVVE